MLLVLYMYASCNLPLPMTFQRLTGKRFQFEGVYNHMGQLQTIPECQVLAYAATSLSMQVCSEWLAKLNVVASPN
jgi:hypothetical protein